MSVSEDECGAVQATTSALKSLQPTLSTTTAPPTGALHEEPATNASATQQQQQQPVHCTISSIRRPLKRSETQICAKQR